MQLADRAQCKNDLRESPFHIEDAWTAHRIAVHRKWSLLDGADRPDGVEVADEELAAAIAAAFRGPRENVAHTADDSRFPDDVADIHEGAGKNTPDAVVTFGVRGRRFRLDQPPGETYKRVLLTIDEVSYLVDDRTRHAAITSSFPPETERRWSGR